MLLSGINERDDIYIHTLWGGGGSADTVWTTEWRDAARYPVHHYSLLCNKHSILSKINVWLVTADVRSAGRVEMNLTLRHCTV